MPWTCCAAPCSACLWRWRPNSGQPDDGGWPLALLPVPPAHLAVTGTAAQAAWRSPPFRAALRRRGLHVVNIADKHGGEEAALFQAVGGFEDARVGALGVNYLAGIFLQNLDKIFKHVKFTSK